MSAMVEEIVAFLRRSGWSAQEIQLVRHRLPAWERHLRTMGITVIPGEEVDCQDLVGVLTDELAPGALAAPRRGWHAVPAEHFAHGQMGAAQAQLE